MAAIGGYMLVSSNLNSILCLIILFNLFLFNVFLCCRSCLVYLLLCALSCGSRRILTTVLLFCRWNLGCGDGFIVDCDGSHRFCLLLDLFIPLSITRCCLVVVGGCRLLLLLIRGVVFATILWEEFSLFLLLVVELLLLFLPVVVLLIVVLLPLILLLFQLLVLLVATFSIVDAVVGGDFVISSDSGTLFFFLLLLVISCLGIIVRLPARLVEFLKSVRV